MRPEVIRSAVMKIVREAIAAGTADPERVAANVSLLMGIVGPGQHGDAVATAAAFEGLVAAAAAGEARSADVERSNPAGHDLAPASAAGAGYPRADRSGCDRAPAPAAGATPPPARAPAGDRPELLSPDTDVLLSTVAAAGRSLAELAALDHEHSAGGDAAAGRRAPTKLAAAGSGVSGGARAVPARSPAPAKLERAASAGSPGSTGECGPSSPGSPGSPGASFSSANADVAPESAIKRCAATGGATERCHQLLVC